MPKDDDSVAKAWDTLIQELSRQALAYPDQKERTLAFLREAQARRHHWVMGYSPDGLDPMK